MQTEVGHNTGAIRTLQQIIDLNPEDAEAYARIGRIYGWTNNFEQSLKYYRQAEMIACTDSTSSRTCESTKMHIDFLLTEMDER